MSKIPTNLQQLFWDIKIETFDPIVYPQYTINRVLELGNEEAIRWLQEIFSELEIKEAIRSDQRLSPKSANFWAIKFNIPLSEIVALKNNRGSIS